MNNIHHSNAWCQVCVVCASIIIITDTSMIMDCVLELKHKLELSSVTSKLFIDIISQIFGHIWYTNEHM